MTGSGGQPGTGGTSTTGGQSGSGGTTAAGGQTGSGGTTAAGGQTGSGGTTASGGRTSSGGTTSGGGTTSSGGLTGSGGTTGSGGQLGSGGTSAAGGTTGQGTGGAGTGGRSGTGGGGGTAIDGGSTGDVKPSAGCGKTPTLLKSTPPPNAKISYNKITSAGLSRQYILWYPDNYDKNRPYRLILNYHWYTGSASQVFDCNTESIKCYTTQTPFFGHLNLAENSTIFVAPDGIDAGWANTNGRDTTLTDDILKQVEEDLCIDTTRVFAQGFSYGGAMSATLGLSARRCLPRRGGLRRRHLGNEWRLYRQPAHRVLRSDRHPRLRLQRRADGGPALRRGQWMHGTDSTRAAHRRPCLCLLRGLLGWSPDPLVSVRRHPHPVAAGQGPIDDLAAEGSLDLLHAVLATFQPRLANE